MNTSDEMDAPDDLSLAVPADPDGHYRLERATEADAAIIVALHDEAGAWLLERGIRQWLPGKYTERMVIASVRARHEIYLVWRADALVGAFSLQWSDPYMWGPGPTDAGYVHGLCVQREFAGRGVGVALLDWAGQRVRACGRSLLRLDCMAANPRLRAWYEAQGFIYQGEAEEGWAALYQRPA